MHRAMRLACIAAISFASFAADMTGTWKMNTAKSKLNPDSDVTASTMKVEKTGMVQAPHRP